MKPESYIKVIMIAVSLGILGAYGLNKIFVPSNSVQNEITVELKSAAYTEDHVTVEYVVNGQIKTDQGIATECPVGASVVLDSSGLEFVGGSDDFVYCRPGQSDTYLVTEFFYNDYSDKQPSQVKVTVGDVDFIADDGRVIHVPALGDFLLDLPSEADPDSVSYPTETSAVASGLEMQISRADFSGSVAKVNACLSLPDSGDWVFDAYLVVDGKQVPYDYWTIPNFREAGVLENSERCFIVIVPDVPDYREAPNAEISFVIEKIFRNMPDCTDSTGFAKIKDELEKYGISAIPDAAERLQSYWLNGSEPAYPAQSSTLTRY